MTNQDERIERLEKQNRRLWSCMFLMLVAVCLFVFVAAYQPEPPDVIQASRFEIVNEDGNVVWRASSSKTGGYAEALRSNGRTKCWWGGASPGDGGGMNMVWGGEDNEFRWVASTWNDGAFTGCIHGIDGKPGHQDGFTAQLDRRRGVRVSIQHDNNEVWKAGESKGLRALPVPTDGSP